jgi:predicted transcriptional regulator of viral defense system
MRATDAYADLRRFGQPILTTRDAALRLRISIAAASKLLLRLAASGLVEPIRRGLWSTEVGIDPLLLPEHLTAPYPSYVSLLTALRIHGMIGQIPRVTYVATLGPTRRIVTRLGVFSAHHLAPGFFGGFAEVAGTRVKLATPEKALLDVLYLSRGRSRLFAHLPELELPPAFSVKEARRWVDLISATYQRTMVRRRLEAIISGR